MKKILVCIPVILFPYTIVVLTVLLISGFLTNPNNQNISLFILLFILCIWISALICAVFISIVSRIKKFSGLEMAKLNMLIKIIQIPAYILIFIFSILSFITIFTIGFSVAFWIIDVVSVVLTGIIGASAVRLNFCQGAINKSEARIYTFTQFVFCLDVIIAILVFTKSKRYNLTNEHTF